MIGPITDFNRGYIKGYEEAEAKEQQNNAELIKGPRYYIHAFTHKQRIEDESWLTIDEGCHLSFITLTCSLCGTEHISTEKDPTTHWQYKIPESITTSKDQKTGYYFHCVEKCRIPLDKNR